MTIIYISDRVCANKKTRASNSGFKRLFTTDLVELDREKDKHTNEVSLSQSYISSKSFVVSLSKKLNLGEIYL